MRTERRVQVARSKAQHLRIIPTLAALFLFGCHPGMWTAVVRELPERTHVRVYTFHGYAEMGEIVAAPEEGAP